MSELQGFSSVDAMNSGNVPQYAGFWWRFLAYFIDVVITEVAALVLGLGLGILVGVVSIALPHDPAAMVFKTAISGILGLILGLAVRWAYFAGLESSERQATLGKMVCKLKVTDMQGERLTFARATGRHFGKYLSTLTLLIGYVMAAFTEKKQALHDLIAGTVVVKV